MTHRKLDRVQETTTSAGSGALNLAGATTRMLSFSAAGLADGDTFWGLIEHSTAAEWEIALCTFHVAGNITRAAPLKSSTGSAISFSAGTKTISLIAPAAREGIGALAIVAGAVAIDLSSYIDFTLALTANVTSLAFSNATQGSGASFMIEVTANGTPFTWADSAVALNGAYTPSSTNGKRDLLSYMTFDGGATWRRLIVAQNY